MRGGRKLTIGTEKREKKTKTNKNQDEDALTSGQW